MDKILQIARISYKKIANLKEKNWVKVHAMTALQCKKKREWTCFRLRWKKIRKRDEGWNEILSRCKKDFKVQISKWWEFCLRKGVGIGTRQWKWSIICNATKRMVRALELDEGWGEDHLACLCYVLKLNAWEIQGNSQCSLALFPNYKCTLNFLSTTVDR